MNKRQAKLSKRKMRKRASMRHADVLGLAAGTAAFVFLELLFKRPVPPPPAAPEVPQLEQPFTEYEEVK